MPLPIGAGIQAIRGFVEHFQTKKRVANLEEEVKRNVLSGLVGYELFQAKQRLLLAEFYSQAIGRDVRPERLHSLMERTIQFMNEDVRQAESALKSLPATKHDIASLAVSIQELALNTIKELDTHKMDVDRRVTQAISALQSNTERYQSEVSSRLTKLTILVAFAFASGIVAIIIHFVVK